jgi:hypothetical protein
MALQPAAMRRTETKILPLLLVIGYWLVVIEELTPEQPTPTNKQSITNNH